MKKKCFVIGPMNDEHIKLLNWLAYKVVAKILNKDEFEIFTPDVKETGNIMNHVIRSCDRSAIVIADITGNNPNVLYEIAVLDAMGRACVPVKMIDKSVVPKERDLTPFDRAQYRTFEIEPGKTAEAVKSLRRVINDTLASRFSGDIQDNPLTQYFKVPLNSFASAHGLARSYYLNLIRPAILEEIIDGPPNLIGMKNLKFQLIIPERMDSATREMVNSLVERKIFVPIKIRAFGRPISIQVWAEDYLRKYESNVEPTIVDIPTTLGTLRENVNVRFGPFKQPNPNSEDYMEIENDEIMQFKLSMERLVNEEKTTPIVRQRFNIIESKAKYPDLFR